jgi:hypothetical protein
MLCSDLLDYAELVDFESVCRPVNGVSLIEEVNHCGRVWFSLFTGRCEVVNVGVLCATNARNNRHSGGNLIPKYAKDIIVPGKETIWAGCCSYDPACTTSIMERYTTDVRNADICYLSTP